MSHFRVAITGTSSGIGAACVSLLRDCESVEVIALGRNVYSPLSIVLDLCHMASVRNAVTCLAERWYGSERETSGGHDIFINNAGVFSGKTPREVWRVNLIAPCFLTETLVGLFVKSTLTRRSLRLVHVGSRLEKQSQMSSDNILSLSEAMNEATSEISSDRVYADTKRGLILHTAYMCSKFADNKQLSFSVVTPGMVNTNLGLSSVSRIVWYLTAPLRFLLLRHPIEGAVAVLWAAFSEENGTYSADPGEVLERISETRDKRAGSLISELVNEQFNVM